MCLYTCTCVCVCLCVRECHSPNGRILVTVMLPYAHTHFHYRQCHSPIPSRSSVKGRLAAASHGAKHTLFHLLTIAITARKAAIGQYECTFFCICGIDRFRRVLRHLLVPGHVSFLCFAKWLCEAGGTGNRQSSTWANCLSEYITQLMSIKF